ncbi:MAG TPA: hypothetical protein VGF97_18830 [Rhizomicrobium sp.]|jgi:hypothetical protein
MSAAQREAIEPVPVRSPGPEQLRAFAARIGRAPASAEQSLFHDAVTLGLLRRDGMAIPCDRVIGAFGETLPDYGFQIGRPPPCRGKQSSRAYALVWQRGDAHATPYEATTPALALLRAMADECARLSDARRLRDCPSCCGAGWSLAADGDRRLCRHEAGEIRQTAPGLATGSG